MDTFFLSTYLFFQLLHSKIFQQTIRKLKKKKKKKKEKKLYKNGVVKKKNNNNNPIQYCK